MRAFILRRLLTGVALLFAACTASFLAFSTQSSRAAYTVIGNGATPESVAAFNAKFGLDRPLLEQYWNWMAHAVRFDFGEPYMFNQPVTELIRSRLGVSFTLLGASMLLAAVLSVVVGVAAAMRGGWIDKLAQVVGLIGFAIPNYLIALGLVLVFAVQYPMFSATGWLNPGDGPVEFLKVATLPIIAIAVGAMGSLTMQIRGSVKDALREDYVRVLYTRGLSKSRVVLKHVLRNACGPALTVFGMQFVGMLGGLVLIEQIFAIPGFGQFTQTATGNHDMPALMGLIAVSALLVVIVNLIIDIVAALLNPKVRLQ